ncbi:MAG: polysaccharide deacetylase family protein [Gammaproteobacteria bacterium]|nr:polysaccharide deacetylase family protein [Gammaproteobacteria bacterium]
MVRLLTKILLLALCFSSIVQAEEQVRVPVLVYHRFGSTVADGMTIKTEEFAAQLKWLKDNGYTVIPLKTLVTYLKGGAAPPAKSVVITADDGHKSVFLNMQPLVQKYKIPVTLFIYPSAISNASYAMTWNELEKLKQTGLFDIQSHTYWHPNFKKDKKKLSGEEYQKLVDTQLKKSKDVLDKKLNIQVDELAWPFGIYDEDLENQAEKAGYVIAFSIDAKPAQKSEKMLSQPRYMIVNGPGMKGFESIMTGATGKAQ